MQSEIEFSIVNGREWHPALETLYRKHYTEMKERLEADGHRIGEYNPRLETYFEAMDRGDLLTFIVLDNRTLVGYSNIWLTNDMHNGELIAQEDTIYMLPDFRNGSGRKLAKFILAELETRGVKRVTISPVTDLRVGKIWERLGFKPVAQLMTYHFEAN
jgi:hypothetical protein